MTRVIGIDLGTTNSVVAVMEGGDTEFLKGEAVEALDLEDENKRVLELGLTPATAQPMLLDAAVVLALVSFLGTTAFILMFRRRGRGLDETVTAPVEPTRPSDARTAGEKP